MARIEDVGTAPIEIAREVAASFYRSEMTVAGVVNVATLAGVLGLTTRRVEQLVLLGMPRTGRGRYPLQACVEWYLGTFGAALDNVATLSCLLRLRERISDMVSEIGRRLSVPEDCDRDRFERSPNPKA